MWRENRHRSFIAIDGGGSVLRALIAPKNGPTLYRELPGVAHGTPNLVMNLAQSIKDLLLQDSIAVERVILSLAAIPVSDDEKKILAATIFQLVDVPEIWFVADSITAYLSVADENDLVIVIGTGITALTMKEGKLCEISGHGYLIGDEGSGYWIGKAGINAALKAVDGRGASTLLLELALEHYKTKTEDLADVVHQLPRPVAAVASFAKLVAAAAELGDVIAVGIIKEAVFEIYKIIEAAINQTRIYGVQFMGGAVPADGILYQLLSDQIATCMPNIRLSLSEKTPLDGAAALAQREALGIYEEYVTVVKQSDLSDINWSDVYLAEIIQLLEDRRLEIHDVIAEIINVCAETVSNGGLIHTFGTGHSHLLAEEIFYRAGGLAAIFPLIDERLMLHQDVVRGSQMERLPGLATELLERHPMNPGDVFFVISNSGGNDVTIELAELAQRNGVIVIAVMSLNHARSSTARSKRIRKLHDVADFVLDNGGIPGDAIVKMPGSHLNVGPTSTVVGAAILQSIMVGTVAELLRRGLNPDVFLSSNLAGGDENNSAIFEKYRNRITLYN